MEFPVCVRNTAIALVITAGSFLTMMTAETLAKGGGGDENRTEFYGVVQARPHNGRQGEWVIGGRTFIADQGTEFDESEGLLAVGSCAKVHVRDGRVHEIDSEPLQNCQ